MELDNQILGELNQRTHRYKYFKIFKLSTTDLEIIKQRDLEWIEKVCESEGYDAKEYLDYYNKRTT